MRALAALLLAAAAPAAAQRASPHRSPRDGPEWRAGASLAIQSRFLKDLNGPSVAAEAAPALEGGASWTLLRADRFRFHLRGGVQARAAFPRVRVDETSDSVGPSRALGRARVVDVLARLERDVDGIVQYHVGIGALWLSGPRDVAPFRFRGVNGWHEAVEVGGGVRIARRPLWLTAAAQVTALPADAAERFDGGPVARATLGVRHGY